MVRKLGKMGESAKMSMANRRSAAMKIPLKTRLRFMVQRMIYAPVRLWITVELFLQTKKSLSRLGMMMLRIRQELGWRCLRKQLSPDPYWKGYKTDEQWRSLWLMRNTD